MRIECDENITIHLDADAPVTACAFAGRQQCALDFGGARIVASKKQAAELLQELIDEYPEKARVLLAEKEDQDRTLEEIDARIARGEAAFPNIERALGERQLTQVNSSEAVGAHA